MARKSMVLKQQRKQKFSTENIAVVGFVDVHMLT